MANVTTARVRKLLATDLASVDYLEDTRGHAVADASGEKVGQVDALYIDDEARKVRFLRVSPEGSAADDRHARKFIVPVDAVVLIRGGTVYLNRKREALAAAPREDAHLEFQRNVEFLCEHYGIQPFWRPSYQYPPYPAYY